MTDVPEGAEPASFHTLLRGVVKHLFGLDAGRKLSRTYIQKSDFFTRFCAHRTANGTAPGVDFDRTVHGWLILNRLPQGEQFGALDAFLRDWITQPGNATSPPITMSDLDALKQAHEAETIRRSRGTKVAPDPTPETPPTPPTGTSAAPTVLPYPTLGTLFKGRDDVLATLRAQLTANSRAALTNAAVLGLGGVGKTRAAVEYAHTHRDTYSAVLFALADSPDALRRNLAQLTGALGLTGLETQPDEAREHAVVKWLNDHPGWLLILDNADSPDAMAQISALAGRLGQGHLLVTSRLGQVPGGFTRLDLDVLSVEAATDFLLESTAAARTKTPDDAAQAEALAKDLGQLSLALTQAAGLINHQGLSFADYRALLKTSFEKTIDWFDPVQAQYPRAIPATWALSVERLPPAGRALLERLSFLAPAPVPLSLLEEDGREALADLVSVSLATRDTGAGHFTVHRLVLDVTRRFMAAPLAATRLTEALGWVDAAFVGDGGDVRSWPVLVPLAEHAETVANHADTAGIADPTARLLSALGVLFDTRAEYARAERASRRALAIDEASLGPDHPTVAIRLNNLALLLRTTNRLGEAEPLYRRALAIDEASLGPDHPTVAIRLNNLAGLLYATNRLAEAEPLYRRALVIDEASLGPDHPAVATGLNNLAGLLEATNRLGEAEPLYRRALAISEASLGRDHPYVATGLNNLAELLRATNRLADAEPLYRRALAIDEASLGPDHPTVARDLNNLAGLLRATNRLARAEKLYRRALAISEASLGPDHPTVATRLNNLAGLLAATNRLAEAEPLYRRALAILLAFERATGHAHPHRDAVIGNYVGALRALGRSDAAITAELETLHREAGLRPLTAQHK
jgi:tetratricopeptide (TPR) repeat protein